MAKYEIEVRLKELLKERNMEQKHLAEITGLSARFISELVNGKTKRFPKDGIEKIAEALEIDDINQIITLVKQESYIDANSHVKAND